MKIARKEIRLEKGVPVAVVWHWSDGETTEVGLDTLGGMEAWFLANGVSQRLGDKYSGIQDVKEAREAMLADLKQVTVDKVWARKGEGGGQVGILAEALHRVMLDNPFAGEVPDLETIRAKVRDMEAKEIKAIKAKWPTIELEIQKIKLERAKAKAEAKEADGEEAMDELGELFAG